MKKFSALLLTVILLSGMLAGCGGSVSEPSAAEISSTVEAPAPAATPVPSETPVVTAAPEPVASPVPTAEPAATPEPEKTIEESCCDVLPDAASFEELAELEDGEDVTAVFCGLDASGSTVGYVFITRDMGFNDKISVMTGIDAEGYITKCKAIDLSCETKIMGGIWSDPEYPDKYTGLTGDDITAAWDSGETVISGATITSSAFRDCVSKAFDVFKTLQ